ncbi:MAG TPA: D-aminoacylase [Gemmataceae bacterium]|nr:D-aminoacylase [Gemmataceae bacterium]
MLPAAGLCVLLCLPAAEAPPQADYVIRGALLCDGTGRPAARGDVAVKGDRIVGVGTVAVAGTPRVIDGTGLVVAPGFIDLHTHSDDSIRAPASRPNLNYVLQGVTTIVTGNCGFGPVDVGKYLNAIDAAGAGSNVAHQVPHNALRQQVMGNANRRPTRAELEKMKALVDRGMRDGAFGLSTGLYYTPGSYADLEELVELSRVVAAHGGFYASHMRDEGTGLLASINETLTIGRRAGVPVHISHLKAYSRSAWGRAGDAIALIEQARRNGQAVTADQYPYTASSTSLAADVIPARYREGSQKDLLARFDDPEQGPKVRQAMQRQLEVCDGGRALRLAHYGPRPDWQGKDLASIAMQEKKPVLDVVLDIERHGGAQIVNFSMQEEEVRLIMKQPFVATASDGAARVPDDSVPHPRNYGCFARKIGHYAITEKLLPLEQAVRSASGLPADVLRLPDRGYLRPGYCADLVVFDPETYRDRATFDHPHQYATGVRWVFVNGRPVVAAGRFTGTLAGKALRHQPKKGDAAHSQK